MAKDKKYYWLKLDKDFFNDDTIVWIEQQENGILYSNVYLKLLLKSLSEEGKLIRYVGDTLMPYDDVAISKLIDMPLDTVRVALKLFYDIGLVKTLEAGELYLTQIDEMIGSETRQAESMRKLRAREKKELEQKVTLLPNVTEPLQKRYIEKEIEKEIENKSNINTIVDKSTSKSSRIEEMYQEFRNAYPKKQGSKTRVIKYYKSFKDLEGTHKLIMEDLKKRKGCAEWLKDNGQFIPNLDTYIYNERWLDEYETTITVDGTEKVEGMPSWYYEQDNDYSDEEKENIQASLDKAMELFGEN